MQSIWLYRRIVKIKIIKMHSIKISDYIEYDEDEFEPGEEWKCTRDSVVNNIKKYYPNVAKIEKIRTVDGSGLKIYSNDIGTLKKIWISLLYADSKAPLSLDKLILGGIIIYFQVYIQMLLLLLSQTTKPFQTK